MRCHCLVTLNMKYLLKLQNCGSNYNPSNYYDCSGLILSQFDVFK